MIHYTWIFAVTPFIGGAMAGLVGIYHEQACITMAEAGEKEKGRRMSFVE